MYEIIKIRKEVAVNILGIGCLRKAAFQNVLYTSHIEQSIISALRKALINYLCHLLQNKIKCNREFLYHEPFNAQS